MVGARPRYRLDGRSQLRESDSPGWPTLEAARIEAPGGGPLQLQPLTGGRLALDSRDGTLGSLTLPSWLAVDDDARVYLVTPNGQVRRFDSDRGVFAPLAVPRRPCGPPDAIRIAANRWLYLCGADELVVLDPRDLGVITRIGGLHDVTDLAPDDDGLLLLRAGTRLAWLPSLGHRLVDLPPLSYDETFDRVVATRDGGRILRRADGPQAVVVDDHGRQRFETGHTAALRPLVTPPPIRLLERDGADLFCLPPHLRRACPSLGDSPLLADPLGPCRADGRVFDRWGRQLDLTPEQLVPPPVLEAEGHWLGRPLAGGRQGQIWRRGVVHLRALPPGTRVVVETYARDVPPGDDAAAEPGPRPDLFRTALDHREPAQRPPDHETTTRLDFHVQAQPGEWLWVRVRLLGDGRASPEVGAIDVGFGGPSQMDLLPGLFRAEPRMRDFLERYLGLVDTEWDRFEAILGGGRAWLDPLLTSERMLGYLASWFGIVLDERLAPSARRRLLALRLRGLGHRGTKAALRARLEALLAVLTGLQPGQVGAHLHLIEGFQERFTLRLGQPGRLGTQGAIHLGGGIELGTTRLDSRTTPGLGDFERHAHRIQVVLPQALLPDATAVGLLERAILEEKPAHVAHETRLLAGGVRLNGHQRLDIDTLLVDPRPLRLQGEATGRGARLGIDARLAGPARRPIGIPLAPTETLGGDRHVL